MSDRRNNSTSYRLDVKSLLAFDAEAEANLAYLNSLHLCAVGITPYARIIPSFFLRDYSIYSATAPTDVDALRAQTRIYTLEEKFPAAAKKVHATSYLLGNHYFQAFLRSRPQPPTLLVSSPTHAVKQKLTELGIPYLASESEAAENIKTKRAFRDTLEKLGIGGLEKKYIPRTTLIETTWDSFTSAFYPHAVVQRADREVGGNKGTFFISGPESFSAMQEALTRESETDQMLISPFIKGPALSMLGCVTSQGTLSGSLQLQFIDVPEALHGIPPNGIFFGNDWGYHTWNDEVEAQASLILEKIGDHLGQHGYRGIFGIDFMFDEGNQKLYPLECNPRITGASPVFSLMLLSQGLPPIEYYHLLALAGRDQTINLKVANEALKQRAPCAHISFSPKNILKMTLPFKAGIYSYSEARAELEYKRSGFHILDIKDPDEFLLIDTLPNVGSDIPQEVPGFFKFIFRNTVGISSTEVDARTSKLLRLFSEALLRPNTLS